MNAVEIDEAVSALAAEPFDAAEFPFRFLAAFGMKEVTLKRLRSRNSNASDVAGGVLQRNNIHLATASEGQVGATLAALRASPKTAAMKAKFVLATDGAMLEAEDLVSGETLACGYGAMSRHFAFFLPLAGISTVREIKNNPVDVKATGRLNKLYVELLRDNPEWATEARRADLNRFMARLIFCFFAEDTEIFHGSYRFTPTVERISDSLSSNTHEVIGQLFRAMGTKLEDRARGNFRPWADGFPYVNGALFTGDGACPRFSRIARAYLLSAGALDWKEINPDIFGSMIQAVADDDERGALGLHYTSVPNILKVLNPLFLDELREQLEAAGDNARRLRALRRRIARIRVFDPACGSGNFLVIAYRDMRAIEAEIVRRTGDEPRSAIRLDNFYGIEIKGFAAEIARLALLIAEFQADCRHIGQTEARSMVLPLHKTGQITIGNALRLDWLKVCPPVGKTVIEEYDLAGPTGRLALDDNGLGEAEPETFICGNPPYRGSQTQTLAQKADLAEAFEGYGEAAKQIDYVGGWFLKAAEFSLATKSSAAFVSTNSICQGRIVPILWPILHQVGQEIVFAYTSFKWANLASHNAGVTVAIVGTQSSTGKQKKLFVTEADGSVTSRLVDHISPYLVASRSDVVEPRSTPLSGLPAMNFGNMPVDGGSLMLETTDLLSLGLSQSDQKRFVKQVFGSAEFIRGLQRYCLWIDSVALNDASEIGPVAKRVEEVRKFRSASKDSGTKALAEHPYRFREQKFGSNHSIIVPSVSSEARNYLPVGVLDGGSVITNLAFGIYDSPLWNMALIASRVHLVWIATVCGKLKTDFRYSNTLGWNTFPVPPLTDHNKSDLTRCAENILLVREAHFPATIADLYDPEAMPDDLRQAHEANDETLERIYIGRRFRNDTERLEKLFELYTKMTKDQPPPKKKRAA